MEPDKENTEVEPEKFVQMGEEFSSRQCGEAGFGGVSTIESLETVRRTRGRDNAWGVPNKG